MNAGTRDIIRHIVALEGWAALPVRRVRAMVIAAIGNGADAETALAFLDRLRQAPELLLEPENLDLLPENVQGIIRGKMRALCRELGVEMRVDCNGQLFVNADQLGDKLGLDPEAVAEIGQMCPAPVGALHTLQ